jgi:hypothetical protein
MSSNRVMQHEIASEALVSVEMLRRDSSYASGFIFYNTRQMGMGKDIWEGRYGQTERQ